MLLAAPRLLQTRAPFVRSPSTKTRAMASIERFEVGKRMSEASKFGGVVHLAGQVAGEKQKRTLFVRAALACWLLSRLPQGVSLAAVTCCCPFLWLRQDLQTMRLKTSRARQNRFWPRSTACWLTLALIRSTFLWSRHVTQFEFMPFITSLPSAATLNCSPGFSQRYQHVCSLQ